ncbi:MAG: hypothetical protein ACC654_06920 [Acidimicrobiia bacterium]
MTDSLTTISFDPSESVVVRTPPGVGYGNWVGGKVSYDDESGRFVLFYRERRPLEHGRAATCGISASEDGITFADVWTATREDFNANSIEEGHCIRFKGRWMVYVSYEIKGTSMWRIDLLEADDLATIDTQTRRTVLAPQDFGLDWIKDPYLRRMGDEIWLYAAVPPRSGPRSDGDVVHAAPLDATVLAVSADGRYFPTIEYVFEAPDDDSWHGRRARVNSMIEWNDGYLAMFDGGRTFYDNYEEHAGLATSTDGRSFERLADPWITSPYGCIRYVCAVDTPRDRFFYFEYTTQDGSHELRVQRLPRQG